MIPLDLPAIRERENGRKMGARCGTIVSCASQGLWWFLIIALSGPAFARDDTRVSEDKKVMEITRNVESNEELYRDIEIVADYKFRSVDPLLTMPQEWKDVTSKNRCVLQGDLIYLRNDKDGKTYDNSPVLTSTLQGYDGEKTRILEQNSVANIKDGRVEDGRIYRLNPYTILFGRIPIKLDFPLSVYLRGGKALRAHRGFEDANVWFTYIGDEPINGVRCHKIRCNFCRDGIKWDSAWDDVECQYIWLAPERNYLPLRMERRYESMGSHPVHEGQLEDLREIEPGIWFPFRATYRVYDENRFKESRRVGVDNEETWTVSKASLNPKYDISLFRDIAIPDGVNVYVVDGAGKILQSYVQGAAGKPNGSAIWRYILMLSLPGVMLGYLIMRFRVRRSTC